MDKTLKVYHFVSLIAGIPIYAQKNWNSKLRFFVQLFNCIVGILCFISTGIFVALSYSDPELFVESVCIWGTSIIMMVAQIICLLFRTKIRQFLEKMAFKDELLEMPIVKFALTAENGPTLLELKKRVLGSWKNFSSFARIAMIFYFTTLFSLAVLFILTPIFSMCIHMDISLRDKHFNMWFPWSIEDFNVYMASFVFFFYSAYLCGTSCPSMHMTIFLLIGHIVRHLRIITFILLNIGDLAKEKARNDSGDWQKCSNDILSQCIKHYIKIKSFSNRMNEIFWSSYLTLILVAIVLVCIASVKIAISDKLDPDIFKYYLHACSVTSIILAACSLGQVLDNESEVLEEAVTEKWYMFDAPHKKNVLIFKMGLSQRMPIYIFGTVTLSFTTFTWFIKSVMSFFTLAMSVLEN